MKPDDLIRANRSLADENARHVVALVQLRSDLRDLAKLWESRARPSGHSEHISEVQKSILRICAVELRAVLERSTIREAAPEPTR